MRLNQDRTCCSRGLPSGRCDFLLVATSEELGIIHTALEVYRTTLHEKTRHSGGAQGEAAIQLCLQRMSLDDLLHSVDHVVANARTPPQILSNQRTAS